MRLSVKLQIKSIQGTYNVTKEIQITAPLPVVQDWELAFIITKN
jgi:hypothetical protein